MMEGSRCHGESISRVRSAQSPRAIYDRSLKAKGRDNTLQGTERVRIGSAYRLNESPVLKECCLILDVIARYPCLDLISESL